MDCVLWTQDRDRRFLTKFDGRDRLDSGVTKMHVKSQMGGWGDLRGDVVRGLPQQSCHQIRRTA